MVWIGPILPGKLGLEQGIKMSYLNESSFFGEWFVNLVNNITGSEFYAMLFIIIILAVVMIAGGIDLKVMMLLLMPIMILFAAYNTAFMALTAGILIIAAFLGALVFIDILN